MKEQELLDNMLTVIKDFDDPTGISRTELIKIVHRKEYELDVIVYRIYLDYLQEERFVHCVESVLKRDAYRISAKGLLLISDGGFAARKGLEVRTQDEMKRVTEACLQCRQYSERAFRYAHSSLWASVITGCVSILILILAICMR